MSTPPTPTPDAAGGRHDVAAARRHTSRVRVTSSRRGAPPVRQRTPAADLVEQTGVGELYLEGLLRAQLRLALTVLGVFAVALLGVPLLVTVVPASGAVSLGGVPLVWVLLGVLVYPVMVALAAWYARQAGRLETRFSDVVGRDH
ncbi:hypothetical protein ACQE98_01250 [Ornithinimicrobium sp. W1679]|uniref:hypothetical protein n=1 Tax=Ornithinimicrobium sp. W1679 TaxID=3418770 RepID=UPI003CFB0AE0